MGCAECGRADAPVSPTGAVEEAGDGSAREGRDDGGASEGSAGSGASATFIDRGRPEPPPPTGPSDDTILFVVDGLPATVGDLRKLAQTAHRDGRSREPVALGPALSVSTLDGATIELAREEIPHLEALARLTALAAAFDLEQPRPSVEPIIALRYRRWSGGEARRHVETLAELLARRPVARRGAHWTDVEVALALVASAELLPGSGEIAAQVDAWREGSRPRVSYEMWRIAMPREPSDELRQTVQTELERALERVDPDGFRFAEIGRALAEEPWIPRPRLRTYSQVLTPAVLELLAPPLGNALASLTPGQMTGVVEAGDFYVLRLLRRFEQGDFQPTEQRVQWMAFERTLDKVEQAIDALLPSLGAVTIRPPGAASGSGASP